MPSKVIRWEDGEQKALYEWVPLGERLYPGVRSMFAIPNGQLLGGNKWQRICKARLLKEMGLRSGASDNFLPVARGHWHGLFIELKRAKFCGRKMGSESNDQRIFRGQMTAQGYLCVVSHGWLEAIEEIKRYYMLPPMPRPIVVDYPGTGRVLIGDTTKTRLALIK